MRKDKLKGKKQDLTPHLKRNESLKFKIALFYF
jgi:hypothetical protein